MTIEILPNMQEKLPYQFFLEIEDEQHLPQAYRLSELFINSVDESYALDFEHAKNQIKENPDLAIIATQNTLLNQQYNTLSSLTSDIVAQITAQDSFGIFDKLRLQSIVAHAFCDLDQQKDQSWFGFSEDQNNKGFDIQYRYNFLIVSQNANTGSLMALSLLSLEVKLESNRTSLFSSPQKTNELTLDSKNMQIKLQGFQAVKQLMQS